MRRQCVRVSLSTNQIAVQFLVQFLGTGIRAGGAMRSDSGSADREFAIGIGIRHRQVTGSGSGIGIGSGSGIGIRSASTATSGSHWLIIHPIGVASASHRHQRSIGIALNDSKVFGYLV